MSIKGHFLRPVAVSYFFNSAGPRIEFCHFSQKWNTFTYWTTPNYNYTINNIFNASLWYLSASVMSWFSVEMLNWQLNCRLWWFWSRRNWGKICTTPILWRWIKMFVLQHVSGKLRLLRLQFVTPFLFSVVVATACLAIKASPVENINAARFDHKLQTLTSSNTDSATTPNTVQLALYDRFAKTPGYSSAKNAKSDKGRSRRNAVSFKRDEAIRRDGDDNLDYFGWNSEMTNSAGLTDLRKYLNSDCIHFQNHKG